jgi:hypothetical protein
MYIYIYMYVCVYIYIYVYTYIYTGNRPSAPFGWTAKSIQRSEVADASGVSALRSIASASDRVYRERERERERCTYIHTHTHTHTKESSAPPIVFVLTAAIYIYTYNAHTHTHTQGIKCTTTCICEDCGNGNPNSTITEGAAVGGAAKSLGKAVHNVFCLYTRSLLPLHSQPSRWAKRYKMYWVQKKYFY